MLGEKFSRSMKTKKSNFENEAKIINNIKIFALFYFPFLPIVIIYEAGITNSITIIIILIIK